MFIARAIDRPDVFLEISGVSSRAYGIEASGLVCSSALLINAHPNFRSSLQLVADYELIENINLPVAAKLSVN